MNLKVTLALVCTAATSLLVLTPVTSTEAASTRVLTLKLNEKAGATIARDGSGLGHRGRIGSHVTSNGVFARFDRHPPNAGVDYGRRHLIAIPDAADGSLDPGRRNFSIQIRFRTKENFGNVLQKGQANTPGGQVKLQIPKGKLSCMFKTPSGTATAGSGRTLLNDNKWHVVRCDRTPTSVTMYVDGVRTGRSTHSTGRLDNNKPWTIGGKADCDAVRISCDYFAGDIGYVTMSKG